MSPRKPPKFLVVSFDHEFSAPVILPPVDTRGLRHNVVTYIRVDAPKKRARRGKK